jgi:hypothetical protein
MAHSSKELKDHLARYKQIELSVTGRTSGRTISRLVWFVLDGDTLYLLPVSGSDTQWYKNVLHDPRISISARGENGEYSVTPITDPAEVKAVVEKFREKYGAGDVKKYYSKLDVAVRANV